MCRGRSRPPPGIVLILVAGLVAVISLLAVLLVQAGRVSKGWSKARSLRGDAALLALDGLEYATARLRQASEAVSVASRTAANACDDWTFRDNALAWRGGISLAASTGPSYLRGEPWTDTGIAPGIFEPGVEAWIEADGDGRFSAYSGRLRGGEPFSRRFSLRVRTSQICVNSGELGLPTGDHDMDGTLNESDPDYDLFKNYRRMDGLLVTDLEGIPNWRDHRFFPNTHLVNILNNLGTVLMDQGVLNLPTHTETVYDSNPAYNAGDGRDVVIELSDLGRIIVGNRPRGGTGRLKNSGHISKKPG